MYLRCVVIERWILLYILLLITKYVYLLTPWCRVLLEKLTGLQLVKKLPAFHGIRRFITAPTSVRHLSVTWASPIQSIYTHPTSWRSVLILSAWVPVTTAWRILRLRIEERPPVRRVAANKLNTQLRTADEGWSSSLGVGRGANNLSLLKLMFRNKICI